MALLYCCTVHYEIVTYDYHRQYRVVGAINGPDALPVVNTDSPSNIVVVFKRV